MQRNRSVNKRIALFGLPGSGKSTFAAKLGKILNIPVHHLDKHYFEANWKARKREEFLATQQAMVNEEVWIIDGNSIATLERFAKAEEVIYFHFPRYFCLWRLLKRAFFPDQTLADSAEGCSKSRISWELLLYLWNFDNEKKEWIQELRQKYPHVDFHIFRSAMDADQYIEALN